MNENQAGIAGQFAQAQMGSGGGEIGQLRAEVAQLRAELAAIKTRLFGQSMINNPLNPLGRVGESQQARGY